MYSLLLVLNVVRIQHLLGLPMMLLLLLLWMGLSLLRVALNWNLLVLHRNLLRLLILRLYRHLLLLVLGLLLLLLQDKFGRFSGFLANLFGEFPNNLHSAAAGRPEVAADSAAEVVGKAAVAAMKNAILSIS